VLASIDRTAYPRFRETVTARELVESFTPTADEVSWARGKTTADQTFLVLVIWLKCYQRMRYFPGLDEVPDAVAGHIRTALGLPDSVAVGVEAVRSAARYRDYVRERQGVKYDAADVRGIAETAIRAAAATKDNPADLINVALEELLESGRELLLASFIHVLRTSARDEVTEMFCKRMAVIHKKGRARLEALREEHRAESERLLEVFGDVLAAVREAAEPAGTASAPDAEKDTGTAMIEATGSGTVDGAGEPAAEDGRSAAARTGEMVLAALTAGGGIAALSASHESVAAHHGNNYLPLCEQYYKSHRPVLFTLLDAIELEATSAERSVLDALEFVKANRDLDRRAEWIEESITVKRDGKDVVLTVDVDAFAGHLWRRTLRDPRRPGMLARRHLEVCVFSHLAAEPTRRCANWAGSSGP
jgi:hypothetical protein